MSRTPAGQDPNVERFAAELRELRLRAGKPDYRELAEKTRFGRTVLSQALNGSRFPSWEVTRALVRALDGDEREWQQRWADAAAAAALGPTPAQEEPDAPPSAVDEHLSGAALVADDPSPALAPPLPHGIGPAPIGPPTHQPAFSTPVSSGSGPSAESRWTSGRWLSAVAVAVVAAGLTAVIVNGGVFGGQRSARSTATCWRVTAGDVRLWDEPTGGVPDSQQWRKGTVFRGTDAHTDPPRLTVPLPNGVTRWVTANPDDVAPSDACS